MTAARARKKKRPVRLVAESFTVIHTDHGFDIVAVIPLRLVSEANAHTHWRQRSTRAKEHRTTVAAYLRRHAFVAVGPLEVVLTRLAPGTLDSDNLAGSAKHCRDGVADWLGIDDGDARVEWRVTQEPSPHYGVRIVIREMTAARRVADLRAQLAEAEAALAAESEAA